MDDNVSPHHRQFIALAIAITLLALALRIHYVLTVSIVNPLGGDAAEYVRYADNMLRGYFGLGDGPDAYRSPGYPLLVLLAKAGGTAWPLWLKIMQAVLGTLTVAGTMFIARTWLPMIPTLLAGLLVALWPHHIAMTAEVLGETLFGFLLVAATSLAVRRKWVASGFVFAAATLTNPVALLFPAVLALVLRDRHVALGLLLPAMLIPIAWSVRPVEGGSDRLWTNLVQGSYPLYHRAYLSRNAHPEPARIIEDINAEIAATVEHPLSGVASIAERLSQNPGRYAKWYLSKPYLLWDWDMRISDAGGPYVHIANRSSMEKPPLSIWVALAKALNGALFWTALVASILGLFVGPAPARIVSVAFLYFTGLHTVLQSEPRYSVPYRPIEMVLVAALLTTSWYWIKGARFRKDARPAR